MSQNGSLHKKNSDSRLHDFLHREVIFGAESTGIAYDILKDNIKDCYRIPTTDKIRSLNLSNCAAILLFLASEQLNLNGEVLGEEPDSMKGHNFIDDIDISTLDLKHKEHQL